MIIQKILFPKYDICSDFDLYFRLRNPYQYSYQNGFVFFNVGDWAHFDTYFNGFMKYKWMKYTVLDNVYLELEISGSLRITLLAKEREVDGTVTNKFLDEIEFSSEKKAVVRLPYHLLNGPGMLSFSIYALSNNTILYGGRYCTDALPELDEEINIAISICTYKREEYIVRNVANIRSECISNPNSDLYNHLHIFISDNAKTLDKYIKDDSFVHIFPNKNVGGAGGFTRCLIEILHNPALNISHVIFMDDDITLDPEVLHRVYAFLKLRKKEFSDIFVGGAMMRLDLQCIQTENGAVWNGGELRSLKHNLNLSSCEACLYNDIEEYCEYNAWWFCVTPSKYIAEDNLPLPIFIRGDDVEFGLRNVNHIVQLNGICVWHEPFENKYSSMMYYYIFRNRLIDNSVRGIEYPLNQCIQDLTKQWQNEIELCRYKNAELLVDGVIDYLKGIDWLLHSDGESLNQSVLKKGYRLVNLNELDFKYEYSMYSESLSAPRSLRFKDRLKKNLHLVKHNKLKVIPVFDPNVSYCFDAGTILNYDYASRRGFLTSYDKNKLTEEQNYFDLCVKQLKKEYSKVSEEYCRRCKELTSITFWTNYLK